jgi:UDP-N-acetylmuramate-alanine ligase
VVARSGLVDAALEQLRPGDLFLTLGAGDITLVATEVVRRLAGR